MLLSSADGETWSEVDPGWPGRLFPFVGSTPALLSGTGGDLTIVTFLIVPDRQPVDDGREGDLWVFRFDGSTWSARGPQETGLDVMPAGARNFRIQELSSITRNGDTIVVVGSSQWWRPFETSDTSFVSVSSLPDGQWRVFGEDSELFGGRDWQVPHSITTLDGLFVAVGTNRNLGSDDSIQRLAAWTSPDGQTWTASPLVVAPGGLDSTPESIASTPAGVLAVGSEEPPTFPIVENETRVRKPVAWFSTDGVNWERTVLAESEGAAAAVVAVGDLFHVVGEMDGFPAVWTSTDGITFDFVDVRIPAFPPDSVLTSWGDGLAGFVRSFLFFSQPNP